MSSDAREREWQFDALDLGPVLRWLDTATEQLADGSLRVASAGRDDQIDVYLDTDDRRVHRAGYSLRVRRVGRGAGGEATLVALASDASDAPGFRSRSEPSERLESTDLDVLVASDGPVGQRVRALVGARRASPLFVLRTRRRRFMLEADGHAGGELTLDETTIRSPAGKALARLRRVEVEVPAQPSHVVERFVEELRAACSLEPSKLSKYEAGLVATGPHLATAPDFGSVAITPDAPIGVVALAVLRRQFAVLLATEPGTRLGDEIEELHDMRVATRRLRAATALFNEVLPVEAVRLRPELGWLGRTLGSVRDLDVQLVQLDESIAAFPEHDQMALRRLRALLVSERAEARARMLEALDSRRYDTLVRRFGRTLHAKRGGRSQLAVAPATALAPDLIEAAFGRVRKAARRIGSGSPPEDYHRVRLACKRFRYALEFLADVYPGQTKQLTRRAIAVQDVLGLNQDADFAVGRLRRLAHERGAELGPETVFAMGELAERNRLHMAELQASFPADYARLDGKPWKAFRKLMAEARPVGARGRKGQAGP